VVVTRHHGRTLDQDLVLGADLNPHSWHRPAHRAEPVPDPIVEGHRGGGLGEAVALSDVNPDRVEELLDFARQRRAGAWHQA
jgi:hypothetical protein